MLRTYAAVLRDGRVEWTGEAPPGLSPNRPVPVRVTLVDPPPAAPPPGDGKALAALFQRIADSGGIASIPDPAAWQREQRRDRPLPGREE